MPLRNPYTDQGSGEFAPGFSLAGLPAYLAWSVSGFVKGWLQTRRLRWLIQGMPAIVLAVLLASLFASSDQPVSPETIDAYLNQAREATSREDYEQAEFYFRKLEQLAPQDAEVIDEHANLYASQGEYLKAMALKEQLIRDNNRVNDAEARLWLAKTALEQDVGLESPLEYAKEHLVAVLEEDPSQRLAHLFFCQLHRMQGNIPGAIEHLEPIASADESLQLQLASLYLQLDPPDTPRAQSVARNAARSLRQKIDATQTSDLEMYHKLGVANIVLQDYEGAIRVYREALTRFNDPQTRREISRAYVAWSDDKFREQPGDIGSRIQLLERALQYAPNEPMALHRMLQIASAEGEGAEVAENALRQALVDGVAPAAVHFSLGTLAAKRGDTETAMRHFRQSEQLNPGTAVTLNNMAYILAQMPGGDLEQALEMANRAIEMSPTAAPFRDTRGQILTRLHRYSEAISDLEYANSKMDDPASKLAICRSLATAYRGLGDAKTADAYQQRADELVPKVEQHDSPKAGLPRRAPLETPGPSE